MLITCVVRYFLTLKMITFNSHRAYSAGLAGWLAGIFWLLPYPYRCWCTFWCILLLAFIKEVCVWEFVFLICFRFPNSGQHAVAPFRHSTIRFGEHRQRRPGQIPSVSSRWWVATFSFFFSTSPFPIWTEMHCTKKRDLALTNPLCWALPALAPSPIISVFYPST